MLEVTWAGWQELGRRYWFLSVGFLYKSTFIFPSLMLQDVSRNGSEVPVQQAQVGGGTGLSLDEEKEGVVWFIVNLMVG